MIMYDGWYDCHRKIEGTKITRFTKLSVWPGLVCVCVTSVVQVNLCICIRKHLVVIFYAFDCSATRFFFC